MNMNTDLLLAQAKMLNTLARNLLSIASHYAILHEPEEAKATLAAAREYADRANEYTRMAFLGE